MAESDTELTEVEGNPFEDTTLVPVNHNPFADFSAADVVRGNQFAFGPAEEYAPGEVPKAFLDRVSRGQALKRIVDRAMSSAGEGFGSEPLGINDEHVRQLRDLGIFYNPATGRPGHVGVLGEAAIDLTANGLDAIMRTVAAGVYGAGGAFGQLVDEFGGGDTQSLKAEREAINLGNQLLIEMGMGHYARTNISRDNIIHSQPIGGLPTEADFRNAAETIAAQRPRNPELERVTGAVVQLDDGSVYVGTSHVDALAKAEQETGDVNVADRVVSEEHTGFRGDFITSRGRLVGRKEAADIAQSAEQATRSTPYGLFAEQLNEKIDIETAERNLRDLWQTRGIHPAEAAHDAGQDAFLRDEIANPNGATIAYHGSPHDFDAFDVTKTNQGLWFAKDADVAARYKFGQGKLYQVKINAPIERMIDRNKPIIQQSEVVQRAIAGIENDLDIPHQAGVDGGTFYSDLARKLAGDGPFRNGVIEANDLLRERGIPGITDGDAHVVFDDKLVEITHKDGTPVAGKERDDVVNEARSAGADVTRPENLPTLEQQPAPPPGSLVAAVRSVGERMGDIGRDIQMMTTPMAAGSRDAMALAKDFANAIRRNRWEWNRIDQDIARRFTPEQRKRMWDAADEESVARQEAAQKDEKVSPVQPGFVRFYHGAAPGGDPTSGGSRWLTPHEDYARHFRATPENPKEVHYVDIPEADFRTNPDVMGGYNDTNNYYMNFNAPENIAKQLKPLKSSERGVSEHMGLATLEPEERAAVEDLQSRAQLAWGHARDLGMVEGEGLPAYTPRMVLNVAEAGGDQRALPLNSIGRNLTTRTSQMLHREHMMAEETEAAARERVRAAMTAAGKTPEEIEAAVAKVGIARDIRSLPLATAKLEDAIAGRTLVNAIQDAGRATGDDTVSIGANPGQGWFTIDHPALYQWRPKFKDGAVVKDEDGNAVFERQPIYIRDDFRGPLQAVLTRPSGATYQAIMSLKGKTMGLIMYSPMIHNMVEFGRAFPAMPVRIFKAYFDGNRAKQDIGLMKEAIDNGLVPIGKRFFNQDITSIMEEPSLTPGRSWTAKVASAVPDLFDPAAGDAVRRVIDKAGDFWHNTLLWDRISDLQMGLYVNFRGDFIRKGMDQQTASRTAAHLANRYAGALPKEAMSDAATKAANFMLFSRSFTIGNLGVLKDMITGMPRDVLAQIERDAGPEAAQTARAVARRKAQMTVGLDVMMAYLGYQIFQVASNVLLGDSTLSEEAHGYVRRMRDVMNDAHENPASLLLPFQVADRLSATYQNEPHLQDRIKIGYMQDGTAIYARNPVGKIGEEFRGWLGNPLETLRRKEGTIAGPMLRVFMNDNGFGHHIYDPNAETPAANAQVIWDIVKYFSEAQVPITQIGAAADLIRGEGDPKYNALSIGLPLLGVTVRKGAPGGPAMGEMYNARDAHQFAFDRAWPDIRKQIQRGDVDGARDQMTDLGVPPGLQRYYVRTAQDPRLRLSPKALRDFYRPGYSTPEQQRRMDFQREQVR